MNDAESVGRRRLLLGLLAGMAGSSLIPAVASAAVPCGSGAWPAWQSFLSRFAQEDGRIVDLSQEDRRSTSEGQAYAMFFALVANDPLMFDRALGWTRHNLCGNRPDLNLPAWLWGKSKSGQWGVIDGNSASDADLWMAYALLEGARLWRRAGLARAGLNLLQLIRKNELIDLAGFGQMVLPGAQGFTRPDGALLNPSYLPLQLFRRFSWVDPKGPWTVLAQRSAALIRGSAPNGFSPDWIAWNGKAFVVEGEKGAIGSYDAIRTYLWAGMLDPGDPLRKDVLAALQGPVGLLRTQAGMAEKVNTRLGAASGKAPVGFAAALLPYLSALRQPGLADAQAKLVPAGGQPAYAQLSYYDMALILFGQGWFERRYRFASDGRLLPAWRTQCSARN